MASSSEWAKEGYSREAERRDGCWSRSLKLCSFTVRLLRLRSQFINTVLKSTNNMATVVFLRRFILFFELIFSQRRWTQKKKKIGWICSPYKGLERPTSQHHDLAHADCSEVFLDGRVNIWWFSWTWRLLCAVRIRAGKRLDGLCCKQLRTHPYNWRLEQNDEHRGIACLCGQCKKTTEVKGGKDWTNKDWTSKQRALDYWHGCTSNVHGREPVRLFNR